MTAPLDGLVVVTVEQALAAPLATRHLADLGARVIKVERPGDGDFARRYDDALGPGFSSWFVWLNRGKESVALDVKSDEGNRLLHRLVARADVFVQNLAPGAAARLGCEHDELRARHPGLVTCSISGYGDDGPYRDRRAYDLLVQAESGLLSLTGPPEEAAKAGVSVVDIAGGMYAYSGILAALLQRARTGTGSHVSVALFDAMVEWLSHQVIFTQARGEAPARSGAHHASIAPYGPYRCRDGNDVVIAVQNTREWGSLCSVLGLPELAQDPRFATNELRVQAGESLRLLLGRRIGELTSAELVDLLEAGKLAWSQVNGMREVVDHPQLAARDRWIPAMGGIGGVGGVRTVRPPVDITGVDRPIGAVPRLGEHTDAVLAWLASDEASEPASEARSPV